FQNGRQLWIPAGFLHGFVTREADPEIVYKCTDHYDKASDGAVAWDSLGIDWGVSEPLLSDKDRAAPAFGDWTSPFSFEEPA
ncbi:dTDP-4-dehydrorhamnose 3,5-epimerase family protein, partial [Flavobacterium sp. I-STPA6A]|uniref:dTDP-4-dehydrorhamnose 3,5-epimerase family protein n=1 Tax=Flavobacterium sp. I-STPA6A TaxID=2590450 RepID=UPI0018EF1057